MAKKKLSTVSNKKGGAFLASLKLQYHVSNDMCCNWYFLATARVYCTDTTFYRVRFIVWFDNEDVFDWLTDEESGKRPESFTDKDVRVYAREMANNWLMSFVPEDINDDTKRREMYDAARETIIRYNKVVAA